MFLLKLFIFSVFALQTCLSQTEESVNDSEPSGYTATDCLSYIYVAWIIFIYSVGLGVETAQFSQVIVSLLLCKFFTGREMIFSLSWIGKWRKKSTFCCGYSCVDLTTTFLLFQVVSNIYTFIPEDCGGYYSGQDAIAPANLLNILLLTSAATNTNNPSPLYGNSLLPLGAQPAPAPALTNNQNYGSSLTNILLSSLGTGAFKSGQLSRSSSPRGGFTGGGNDNKNYQLLFDIGMKRLKKDSDIYKHIRRIKNPFNSEGKPVIDTTDIKYQIRNRKLPCKYFARRKFKQICIEKKRKSRTRRLKNKINKARKSPQNENNANANGIIKEFWDSILNWYSSPPSSHNWEL